MLSDGEIVRIAPYKELLASCKEFQGLVNAHKETVSTESLEKVASQKANRSSKGEIKHCFNGYQQNSEKESGFGQLIKKEEKETGDTGLKPYVLYLNQNKGFLYASLAILCHIIFLVGQILQNSWMAANVQNPQVSTLWLISFYIAIGVVNAIFLFIRAVFIAVLGLLSSISLFSRLLNSLFQAPMSFFDSTPLGRILSRVRNY